MKFGFEDNRFSDMRYLDDMKGRRIECDKLYPSYKEWCAVFGLKPCSVQAFFGELRRRKIKRCLVNGKMVYVIG